MGVRQVVWVLAVLGLLACGQDDDKSTDASTPSIQGGFASPVQCAACHPNHFAQWSISNHAYAIHDPVFEAMVQLGQEQTEGELGDFCVECHSPIAARTDQAPVVMDSTGAHRQPLDVLDPIATDGISCDVCHTMTSVEAAANARFDMTPDGTRRATIADPIDNDFHTSSSSVLHERSQMCGSCHNVVIELFTEAFRIESTFREWQISRFNGVKECQDCHMEGSPGQAAVDGPEREVHDHRMIGVDVSLLPPEAFPGYDEMREATTALLQESAELEATFDASRSVLELRIDNLAGHALPTGATADREMWIELLVRDDAGELVFSSGTLDERGDLKQENPEHTLEPGADPQLTVYRQKMIFDPSLEDPTDTTEPHEVDFLWQPNTFEENLVPAGGVTKPAYDLSELPAGEYDVSIRMLFRSFPPHLLRKLVDEGLLDPDVPGRVPTVEMETLQMLLTVP